MKKTQYTTNIDYIINNNTNNMKNIIYSYIMKGNRGDKGDKEEMGIRGKKGHGVLF